MRHKKNVLILLSLIHFLWAGLASGQNNTLIGNGSGPPGSVNNRIPISLSNQDTVAGIVLTLDYDPTVLTPTQAVTVDRTQNQTGLEFYVYTPGELLIILFDFNGNPILPSSGEILQVLFEVNASSLAGQSSITITDAAFSSTLYDPLSVSMGYGTFTVTGTPALAPPINLDAQVTNDTVILEWDAPLMTTLFKPTVQSAFQSGLFFREIPSEEPSIQLFKDSLPVTVENTVDEVEPNNTISQAQVLTGDSVIHVNGSAEISDTGELGILTGDDIEDLFFITIFDEGLNVSLTNFTSDCDLYLYEVIDSENIDYTSVSLNIGATYPEDIMIDTLKAGNYLIGVSIFDPSPLGPDSASYLLSIEGNFGVDQDMNLQSYNVYRSTLPNAVYTGALLDNVDSSTNSLLDQPPSYQTYYYQVTAVYGQGESIPSNEASVSVQYTSLVDQNTESLPDSYMLVQNFPNPFNPETTIQYALPEAGQVIISVYNVIGERITTLVNRRMNAGYHTISWNGRDSLGKSVSGGIYFCRIQAGNFIHVIRMLLLK